MFDNLKELFAGISVAAAEGSARTSRAASSGIAERKQACALFH